jgi:Holliday junction resolvase
MAVNSKRKGARGEREAVNFLKSIGFPDARRTQQYNGDGESDVICPESLPGLTIEVKYGRDRHKLDLGTAEWFEAIEQAKTDAAGDPWVLLWRPKGCRDWRMTLEEFDGLPATYVGNALRAELERIGCLLLEKPEF